jgi:hypothetical protein
MVFDADITTTVKFLLCFAYLLLHFCDLLFFGRPCATSVYHPALSSLPSGHLLSHVALHLSTSYRRHVHADHDGLTGGLQRLLPWGQFYQLGVDHLPIFYLAEEEYVEEIAAVRDVV